MGVLKFTHWKVMLLDCDTHEEINNILEMIVNQREDFSELERYELALQAVTQIKKIAGVK